MRSAQEAGIDPYSLFTGEPTAEVRKRTRTALAEHDRVEGNTRLRRLGVFVHNLATRPMVHGQSLYSRRFRQQMQGTRGYGAAEERLKRHQQEKQRRDGAKRRVKNETIHQYREEHPEIEQQEEAQWRREKQQEAQAVVSRRRAQLVEAFSLQRADSYSHLIPWRPSVERKDGFMGDYGQLAKSTLEHVLAGHKQSDGSIMLMNGSIDQNRFHAQDSHGVSLPRIEKNEKEYSEGVATLLWQLGFVQFETDLDVSRGHGTFNPELETTREGEAVRFRIPYDSTSELHRMLAPEAEADSMIELEMPSVSGLYRTFDRDPYLALRVVEADTLAAAA